MPASNFRLHQHNRETVYCPYDIKRFTLRVASVRNNLFPEEGGDIADIFHKLGRMLENLRIHALQDGSFRMTVTAAENKKIGFVNVTVAVARIGRNKCPGNRNAQ